MNAKVIELSIEHHVVHSSTVYVVYILIFIARCSACAVYAMAQNSSVTHRLVRQKSGIGCANEIKSTFSEVGGG